MATIRVHFSVPDGDYCTDSGNKCRFRSLGQVNKEDRYIIKCRLFNIDLVNVEYQSRNIRAEVSKCELCLKAHI